MWGIIKRMLPTGGWDMKQQNLKKKIDPINCFVIDIKRRIKYKIWMSDSKALVKVSNVTHIVLK